MATRREARAHKHKGSRRDWWKRTPPTPIPAYLGTSSHILINYSKWFFLFFLFLLPSGRNIRTSPSLSPHACCVHNTWHYPSMSCFCHLTVAEFEAAQSNSQFSLHGKKEKWSQVIYLLHLFFFFSFRRSDIFHCESTSAKHYADDKSLEVYSFYTNVHSLSESAIK